MDELKGKKSYFSAPFGINEPPAGTVGAEVVESNHEKFSTGDIVTGFLPWQKYSKADGAGIYSSMCF